MKEPKKQKLYLPPLIEVKRLAKEFGFDLKSMWYMRTFIDLSNSDLDAKEKE
jgi:hypothetical protein